MILLSPTATELNRRLLELPKTAHVEVGLPNESTRRLFVQQRLERFPVALGYPGSTQPIEEIVQDSRGLSLRALDDLLTDAHRSGRVVDRPAVLTGVNAQLQTKLGTIIKVVHPDHSFADVVGFSKLKRRLERLKHRMDNPERAPAGVTVVGPNGAGKTFILEAFAAHTGRVAVTLSQIRSEWFGKTDVFAEMLESTLSVFGRILVLIDEAHAAFGSIHDRQTHETEARLTRHIIQMMDNESARSRIFWVLITTRPDMLDPDLVRRGRCSLFVPIFDPEGEDAEEFVRWMLRRFQRAGIELADHEVALLRERSSDFSAGDYREFIDDFIDEREFEPSVTLAGFLDSWTPSTVAIADERALQIHLAALRCDWRELLPARLKDMPRNAVQAEIERLRILTREG
jgi:AAA+ superfamily predicted ATPase